jgi:2-oxo-4-hydroxy-4-carboxy-5-ureidoimidazoline decarboxylase
MTLEELNKLPTEEAVTEFTRCCGASHWVTKMVESRPFASEDELYEVAKTAWFGLTRVEWLEAFSHHPKIGDISSLEEKYGNTKEWAGEEQGGVASAHKETLEKLARLNKTYEKRYGYIFIVMATGKSAAEMLEIIELRMKNNPYDEIKIAASEQNRITRLRLKKLLS